MENIWNYMAFHISKLEVQFDVQESLAQKQTFQILKPHNVRWFAVPLHIRPWNSQGGF